MHYDDGKIVRAIISDGALRLDEMTEEAEFIDGLATVIKSYGSVRGLPEGVTQGDVLLVSTLVGDCWKAEDRPLGVTVLVPDTGSSCKRDADGRIVSVSRFIRK